MTGLLVAAGVLAVATVIGLWWRSRNGRLRVIGPPPSADRNGEDRDGGDRDAEVLAALGVVSGTPVTLVQFSSAVCAPCRVAARVCAEIAGSRDGVTHLEVDAENQLDPVRSLGVWRTPTVLVVDSTGRIRYRSSGAVRKTELDTAVAAELAATTAAR
ncbi:hypothetical protein Raf01_68770 [Rugosimonospora africana]|uniref:Thioredoxin domain-containing protein n=1 Tax=Rugosimonospora africana TaxID=556532 RepID=A0A8J3QWH3_9ACTN|nr:hypothetical protein Raf01_68770 [Rugosimonospora africana]